MAYEPESEVAEINRCLDAIVSGEKPRDPTVVKQVDDLILATKRELIQESIELADQAAWEERMLVNTVLEPVPVRVDPRMRPPRSRSQKRAKLAQPNEQSMITLPNARSRIASS